jgi:hypothetical protein
MAGLDDASTVKGIKQRMMTRGVDLDLYIGRVTNSWDSTPHGFGFTCKDQQRYEELMAALVNSMHFGTDTGIGASQHKGASFREISTSDSAHIVLSRRPDAKSGATCSIHVDSVSPVAGRDEYRKVIYDCGKALQHVFTDLLHTPLIVPGSEQGLVFGIRF